MSYLIESLKFIEDVKIKEALNYISGFGEDIEHKVMELFPRPIELGEQITDIYLVDDIKKIVKASANTLKVIQNEEQPEGFPIEIKTFPGRRNFLGGFAIGNVGKKVSKYTEDIYLVSFTDYYEWVNKKNFEFNQLQLMIAPPAYERVRKIIVDGYDSREYGIFDSRSTAFLNYGSEYGCKLAEGKEDPKEGDERTSGWMSRLRTKQMLNLAFSDSIGWNFNFFRRESESLKSEYKRKLLAAMNLEMSIYLVEELKDKIVGKGYTDESWFELSKHETYLEKMLRDNQTNISTEILNKYNIDTIDLWDSLYSNIGFTKDFNWQCILEAGVLSTLTFWNVEKDDHCIVVNNTSLYTMNAIKYSLFFDDMKVFDKNVCVWKDNLTEVSRSLIDDYNIDLKEVLEAVGKIYFKEGNSFVPKYIVEACIIQYLLDKNEDIGINDVIPKNYAEIAIAREVYMKDMIE